MTQTLTKHQQYETDFLALKSRLNGREPAWLTSLRDAALARFQKTGFPVERKGNEAWKYTDIRPIAEAVFEYAAEAGTVSREQIKALLPFDVGMVRAVFVDGHFSTELSSGLETGGITVIPLSLAARAYSDDVQPHLGRHAQPDKSAFTALNTALFTDGAFIGAGQAVKTPVHVVYVTTDGERTVTYPRTLVVAARLSELTLVETYVSLGGRNHFTDAVTEIVLADGAKVDHYRLLLENAAAYHVGHVRVVQGRDTNYSNLSYETGSGLGRVEIETLFDGQGSSAQLHGLYVTSGDQHIDNVINIDHAKPHNRSRLYYKGILDGRSSAAFGGTVFVRKGADKTDAHQEDKNLLLSHEAEVDSKPALEIYADDVKAGHGATAGALADESLFYMQSRGIDEFTAMQLLVRGFASEITDTVAIDALREWLERRTLKALPRFRQVV